MRAAAAVRPVARKYGELNVRLGAIHLFEPEKSATDGVHGDTGSDWE